jgi:chromate transporter
MIFLSFAKIGLTSFGGGLSGWLLREFVQKNRWLTEEAFMNGMAISQALPGVNVVNLAIWIGYQWRGGLGALLAALGMVVPPMFAALLVLLMFDQVSQYPLTRIALAGVAAGAVGLTFNMGLRALRRSARSIVPALFALATFSAIFIFEMPLYIVVLTLGPLSIAWAYWRMHTRRKA